MDWFTGFIVYFMIFWTALFVVLPWNLEKKIIKPEEGISGAPVRANIKKKFLATAILSAAIWLVVFVAIEFQIIDFRHMAAQMEGIE